MTTPTISAGTAKALWTDPTTNTDGTPITSGEVTGFTLGIGLSTGSYTILTPVTGPTATSVAIAAVTPVLVPGTVYFAAVRTAGPNPSGWSNEFSFTLAAEVPSPPTAFIVG